MEKRYIDMINRKKKYVDTMRYLEDLCEELEALTNNKMTFKIGTFEGEYYLGNEEWDTIKGDLYIKINQDTIFQVKDELNQVADFDVLDINDNVRFINKTLDYTGV